MVSTLLFLWLPSTEFAIKRVATRIKQGGHAIPEDTIKRRYHRGLENLMAFFMPLCDNVMIYDGSNSGYPHSSYNIIAKKVNDELTIFSQSQWNEIAGIINNEKK